MTDMIAPPALPTVSLCMIVKNEAQNLPQCLESVQGIADELIVADTGSTDETAEVAQRHGARVLRHPWQGNFALARNASLAEAQGDWILHLDADEVLEPESRPRLKAALAAADAEGLNVCVRNFNPPSALTAYFDSPQVRLFRNRPAYRYEQPIHELILPSICRQGGWIGDSDLVIWHYGYARNTVQGQMERAKRNLYLLEQAVAESPQDAGHCARLGFSYYQLGQHALAYAYLRRALMELDSHRFTPDFFERVLYTLWDIADKGKDDQLAWHCAQALEALRDLETLSVPAAYALAHTYWREGEQTLEAALQMASTGPEALARLQAAHQALHKGGQYFAHLRQHRQLSASAVDKVEADMHSCQAGLAKAADYVALGSRQLAAEEALRRLQAADDPPRLMESGPEIVNPDVLALARTKAKAARAQGNMELAEGLDKLAANIAESLALPPEAPGVEKPDDYYAWARPQRPRKQPATSALASPGGLVSIIILTLNNLALTRDCLASIERFTAPGTYELIAVDNGSTDGTVEYLRGYAETRPHVQAVINAENRGFAAGNNQGLTLAHGDYVVFLNNDTAVSDQWLSRMLAIFERYPETGVVGPMTDRAVGPQLIPAPLFGSLEEVQAFAEHWAQEHAGESRRFPRVIGFCLMAQRRVIAAIGGLDPRYVNGNLEDDDFCLRAIKAGFDVRLAQEVFIHHVGGQTFKNAQLDYAQNLRRNWMLFKAKWGLPSETPLEGGYQVPERVPPEALRPVALPELATSHESDSSGRWWRPRQKKEARNAAAGA